MGMQEFRRMAARIDQQMGLLAAQNVVDEHAIINRMMGYVPDLHKIWTGTSDKELIALSSEFPGFYRYAFIMEEAFEAERRKASRPYDHTPEFPEQHKRTMEVILTNSATLERGYQAFLQNGCPTVLRPQVMELNRLHRAWLADIAAFTNVLKEEGASVQTLDYLEIALAQMTERVAELAKRCSAKNKEYDT